MFFRKVFDKLQFTWKIRNMRHIMKTIEYRPTIINGYAKIKTLPIFSLKNSNKLTKMDLHLCKFPTIDITFKNVHLAYISCLWTFAALNYKRIISEKGDNKNKLSGHQQRFTQPYFPKSWRTEDIIEITWDDHAYFCHMKSLLKMLNLNPLFCNNLWHLTVTNKSIESHVTSSDPKMASQNNEKNTTINELETARQEVVTKWYGDEQKHSPFQLVKKPLPICPQHPELLILNCEYQSCSSGKQPIEVVSRQHYPTYQIS